MGRGRAIFPLVSIFLLTPCYWQSRLQAGDLSSHIYNAWLAQLISHGQAPGLTIVRLTTNVLFDLILSGLFSVAGAEWAQRISVSLAVMVFIWGSFAFVSVVAGRRAWHMLPIIAMLAYGWVFHMGFFSFYLSLGMCFWALSLAWGGDPRRVAAAIAVLVVAWTAHALPVAWTAGVLVYAWLARRGPRLYLHMMIGAALGMIVLKVAVGTWTLARWYPAQIFKATGLDQVSVFDDKYWAAVIGLLVVWALAAVSLFRQSKVRDVVSSIPFQVCALTAFGIFILPTAVLLPGYRHFLSFIADRMSLPLAIVICGVLGSARTRPYQHYAAAVVAAIFFAFLFRDESVFNSVEDRMLRIVSQLPPGQRVIGAIEASALRVNGLSHMIDRVCIGRCYSYANYEPSTTQFRIRVVAENPIVTAAYLDSWEMQVGTYLVKQRELPLYEVNLDQNRLLVMLSLLPGVPNGVTEWNPL